MRDVNEIKEEIEDLEYARGKLSSQYGRDLATKKITELRQELKAMENTTHPAQGLEQFPPQITPWDLFAAAALQGMLSSKPCVLSEMSDYCHFASVFANAMMKQREVKDDQ